MGISDDQKKKVAELFELGWSDGMISAEVGLSRNAVIGYRHRAGLIRANGTASVVRRGRKPIERKSPNASASPSRPSHWLAPPAGEKHREKIGALEGDDEGGVEYMSLRDGVHCRAILGDRKDREGHPLSCGRQIVSGSYCGRHAAIFFTKPEPRRR